MVCRKVKGENEKKRQAFPVLGPSFSAADLQGVYDLHEPRLAAAAGVHRIRIRS
jgi:hypothetical protein